MNGRLIFRTVVTVSALYVLIALAAALARVPGPEVSGDALYAENAVITAAERELYELRTEDIVP
jgi:hypothetical protein